MESFLIVLGVSVILIGVVLFAAHQIGLIEVKIDITVEK